MELNLHSKRLNIRPLLPEDYQAAINVYRKIPFLTINVSGQPPENIDLALVEEEASEAAMHGALYCGIFLNGKDELTGIITFEQNRLNDKHTAWISFLLIAEPYRGQGFATEAYQLIERHIFTDPVVNRIELGVLPNNLKGKEFWQRIGYQELGPGRISGEHTVIYMRKQRLSP
jgi:RimJ/RimL family protein N-acetyltransferase